MNDPKTICVNCKWHRKQNYPEHVCSHPALALESFMCPVFGRLRYRTKYGTAYDRPWSECAKVNYGDCEHFELKPWYRRLVW